MRIEYPRPDFRRKEWMSLNGTWSFYINNQCYDIQVPYVYQSKMSGIGNVPLSDNMIYVRTFCIPSNWNGKRVLLHFGAVDYQCHVLINGQNAGMHKGGQTPFTVDITDYLTWKEERIKVVVYDPLTDETIARGKQFWEEEPKFIWYRCSSGIWQSVWLEPVNDVYLDSIRFTTNIDNGSVKIEWKLNDLASVSKNLKIHISRENTVYFDGNIRTNAKSGSSEVEIFQNKVLNGAFHHNGLCWTPETPVLFDVSIHIDDEDRELDHVETYFGMRKVSIEGGKLYLNNRPYYQKLILDQGYWRDSLITAPEDSSYEKDIQKAKAMGFNGCRKHEKVEDPMFLYYADTMGFLVWESMASFWNFSNTGAMDFINEWMAVLTRDYNHPSIVVWGMLNESWGVPNIYENLEQQYFSETLYSLAKSLDGTRPVIGNDGWEQTKTDIAAFHTYKHGEESDEYQKKNFREGLKSVEGLQKLVERRGYAKNYTYEGQPVMLTEFGGISVNESQASWGYTQSTKEQFYKIYERILGDIYDSDIVCGYCYTQLSDIQQETNGLLDENHEFKFIPEEIKRINDRKGKPTINADSAEYA